MKDTLLSGKLSEYNGMLKENDEIYHRAAKTFGMSDCTFWILYSLRESGNTVTQSEICSTFYQPKQTVNSALKKLESDGIIKLIPISGRRSKEIVLTDEGKAFAEATVDRVIRLEKDSLFMLTNGELEVFLKLFRKYTDLLKDNIGKL